MFSWSIRWIWAQCLMIGAGLFLLAHMAVPGSTTLVQGTVEEIGLTSRKGLGSFYDLQLKTDDGRTERVLVARSDVAADSIQRLFGRKVVTRVNWSSQAINLVTHGDASIVLREANSSATARNRTLSLVGWMATILGLLIGATTFAVNTTAWRMFARTKVHRR